MTVKHADKTHLRINAPGILPGFYVDVLHLDVCRCGQSFIHGLVFGWFKKSMSSLFRNKIIDVKQMFQRSNAAK